VPHAHRAAACVPPRGWMPSHPCKEAPLGEPKAPAQNTSVGSRCCCQLGGAFLSVAQRDLCSPTHPCSHDLKHSGRSALLLSVGQQGVFVSWAGGFLSVAQRDLCSPTLQPDRCIAAKVQEVGPRVRTLRLVRIETRLQAPLRLICCRCARFHEPRFCQLGGAVLSVKRVSIAVSHGPGPGSE
jgi:hypothetical protein